MSQDSLVFVSCADSGDVHVLRLNAAQGTLDTVQVLTLGGTLMPMALSPDQGSLYVARRSDPLAVVAIAIDRERGGASVQAESAGVGRGTQFTVELPLDSGVPDSEAAEFRPPARAAGSLKSAPAAWFSPGTEDSTAKGLGSAAWVLMLIGVG